jgi:hypothetical protein
MWVCVRLDTRRPAHLTYATSIHAGESWADVRRALEGPVADVRSRVAPNARFGVGLRLAARTLRELMSPLARAELEYVLARHGLYVFTVDAFPYGALDGHAVKERACRPDWLEHARLAYTCRAADLLASLLPEDVTGSISTLPGAHGARAREKGARNAIATRLLAATKHLARLEERTGRRVVHALDPEPGGMLEGALDTIAFFRDHVLRSSALDAANLSERDVRRHLGVCIDACHFAVAFERPCEAIDALERAGIVVGKVQASAAIQIAGVDAARALLPMLDDGVHPHETSVLREDGSIRRYDDLPRALTDAPDGIWRTHVRVPIDRTPPPPFDTTQSDLAALIRHAVACSVTSHFEVETFAWHALPPVVRGVDLLEDISRELAWTRAIAEAA